MGLALRFLLLAFILSSPSPAADGPPTTLTIEVRDSEGAVISKALVYVHWDPSARDAVVGLKEDLRLTTDDMGRCAVQVPSGFYDIHVSSAAFTPASRKIRVKSESKKTVTLKLDADPLVTSEIGDVIGTPIKQRKHL